jgi:hypothetical protein
MRSYAGTTMKGMGSWMAKAEIDVSPTLIATAPPEMENLSRQLYYMLIMLCRGAALDMVVNAGQGEGLEAWRLLVQRFEPKASTRFVGQLLNLLSYDMSGEIVQKIEAFERESANYERGSGEVIVDGMKIGVTLRNLEEGPLKQHMLLNADRFKTWIDFRNEIINIKRAMSQANATSSPMQLDALAALAKAKGGKKGAKGATDRECYNCGKKGHLSKDCWSAAGKSKGKGDKKAAGKTGKGKDSTMERKCFKCGKTGHFKKDCRSVSALDVAQSAAGCTGGLGSLAQQYGGLSLNCLDKLERYHVHGLEYYKELQTQTLSAIDGVQKLIMGVDSGAAVTVIPQDCCRDYPIIPNEMSQHGGAYRAANGQAVPDLGTRVLNTRTPDGQVRSMKARVCPVNKGLLAVSEMVDAGHTVVFSKQHSFARHDQTGVITNFTKRNKVYELELSVLPCLPQAVSVGKAPEGVVAALAQLQLAPFQGPARP